MGSAPTPDRSGDPVPSDIAGLVSRLCPDGLIVIGADLTIRWANPAIAQLTGYPIEEVVGRCVIDFVPPAEVKDAAEVVMVQASGASRSRPAVFHLKTARGELVPVEALGNPAFGDNAVDGLVVSVRAIETRGGPDGERRLLERLIAMTASRCLSTSVEEIHAVVRNGLREYRETIGAAVATFELMAHPQHGGGWSGADRDPRRTDLETASIDARIDGYPGSIFADLGGSIDADPESPRGVIDAQVLEAAGARAVLHCSLDNGNGWIRAYWTEHEPITAYYFLHEGLGNLLAGSIRRADAQAAAERLARVDPLTGLANRAELWRFESDRRRGSAATDGVLAVVFADIDGFKAINDSHGHHHGDDVLVETGRRLRSCVRTDDLVARLGGDEFVVVSTVASAHAAELLRQRIAVALAHPFAVGHRSVDVRVSIGMIVDSGRESLADLLRRADAVMYRDKQAVRGNRL